MADKAIRLGRAQVRLFGFGPKALPTALAKFDYMEAGEPPIAVLEDVVFHPQLRCLYDRDGRRIEITKPTYMEPGSPRWPNRELKLSQVEAREMPERFRVPAGLERVTEPVLLFGQLNQHFGHFLTDTMARMWALDRLAPGQKVLFTPDLAEHLDKPFVRFVLDTLGLPRSRILRSDKLLRLDRVICPLPSLQYARVYRMFDRPHVQAAASVLRAVRPLNRTPVYLSRGGLGRGHRSLPGEELLEQRLAREGYLIVKPEQLPMAEQIRLFNGLGPVAGAFGSALHTLAFRDRLFGQKLGILFPDMIVERFLMVDMIKGSRSVYVNAMREVDPVEDRLLSLNERTWAIDAEAAMAGLSEGGLLSRPRRR